MCSLFVNCFPLTARSHTGQDGGNRKLSVSFVLIKFVLILSVLLLINEGLNVIGVLLAVAHSLPPLLHNLDDYLQLNFGVLLFHLLTGLLTKVAERTQRHLRGP